MAAANTANQAPLTDVQHNSDRVSLLYSRVEYGGDSAFLVPVLFPLLTIAAS